MFKTIRNDATAKLTKKGLSVEGTNSKQIGDVLADILILIPFYLKGCGWVSLTVYLQAKEIYEEYGKDLHAMNEVTLSGHSLGAGICQIIACFLKRDGYLKPIHVYGKGGVKCLSSKVNTLLIIQLSAYEWVVNYRDPIPFLGWWSMPIITKYTGDRRKHIFDWSMEDHVAYWD